MAAIVKYLNSFGKPVSVQQLHELSDYIKQVFVNNELKKVETIYDNKFFSGKYFLNPSEDINDAFQEIFNEENDSWVFYSNKETAGLFTLWDWVEYNKNKELVFKGKSVFDNKDRKIFSCSFDIATNALNKYSHKYFYSNDANEEDDLLLTFEYDSNGQVYLISDQNDHWGYGHKALKLQAFLDSAIVDDFIWGQHPYYHSAYPFLPEGPL